MDTLYGSAAERSRQTRRQGRADARAARRYAKLKAERWNGFAGYDGWFERANNASFGVLAAYNELVPQFERLFEREGRDFARFYAEVERLAALPKAERHATLRAIHSFTLSQGHELVASSEITMPDINIHRNHHWAWPRRARWPGNGPKTSRRIRHGVHRDSKARPATRSHSRAPASTAS